MKADIPNILLVNPWIHDFAAYDFWAKPIGLLYLAAILRQHDFDVTYIDCLDRFHIGMPKTNLLKKDGKGPYLKTKIKKPAGLEDVYRNFSRYGIKPEWFIDELMKISEPDIILITSSMTYWYTGVIETIKVIKQIFPDTPIVVGGIYATLFKDHALQNLGADQVVSGPGEEHILNLVEKYTGFATSKRFKPDDLDTYPYPAFDLQRQIPYVPLMSSRGCPFSCSYCASTYLHSTRMVRSPELVVEEIQFWQKKYSVQNFVFYDDALLVDPEKHIIPILENIIRKDINVRFHTPNALHIRYISNKIAKLMFKAGFKTIKMGLETYDFENRKKLDQKVTKEEFLRAVSSLKNAGFIKKQIGVYLLVGLPGQTLDSVIYSAATAIQKNITPVLTYYSPIPHTNMWKMALSSSRYDIKSDPIFSNNAIFPCWGKTFSWETISKLKKLIN